MSQHDPDRDGRRDGLRRGRGCLAVLLALVVLVGGLGYAGSVGFEALRDRLAADPPPDYSENDSRRGDTVLVEVKEGENATDIGRRLERKRVVRSVEAFSLAASEDPDSVGIQVGFYEVRRKMPADTALDVLLDPGNLVQSTVTVPEGLRLGQTVAVLARGTDFDRSDYRRVLARPQRIGLPPYADGEPEGYLFPATYPVPPDATARSVLTAMVDRFKQAATDAELVDRASGLGYSPAELVTVASLVEAEASRDRDRARVARVVYNRLETGATDGLLQLDATVNYAAGRALGARTSAEDRRLDSPYNTYRNPGLPPGPIEAPGEAALTAAADPAEGGWVYYVTVNLRTGETRFAETFSEHQDNVAELDEYCRTSEAC